jgi:hypothetical protein
MLSEETPSLRVYVAKVPKSLQPEKSVFRYPAWSEDWGIEQDFLDFLLRQYDHLVKEPGLMQV